VVPRSIPIIFPMAYSLPAYKCFKISALFHNNKVIMRYECVTVKGLDVGSEAEVARKNDRLTTKKPWNLNELGPTRIW